MTITLTEARTAEDFDAVRTLCWAYRDLLMNFGPDERAISEAVYAAPDYERIMASLEREHARPDGIVLLARKDGVPVGCGMTHRFSATATEIKRVFLTEDARGSGLGRRLCTALIEQARADGYRTVLLDTSVNFAAARALYRKLGFVERGPYQPLPAVTEGRICFYELTLPDQPAG